MRRATPLLILVCAYLHKGNGARLLVLLRIKRKLMNIDCCRLKSCAATTGWWGLHWPEQWRAHACRWTSSPAHAPAWPGSSGRPWAGGRAPARWPLSCCHRRPTPEITQMGFLMTVFCKIIYSCGSEASPNTKRSYKWTFAVSVGKQINNQTDFIFILFLLHYG